MNIYQPRYPARRYMSTAKIFGVPKTAVRNDDDWTADTSANVASTNAWHWYALMGPIDPEVVSTYIIRVTINYYVKFFKRRVLDW